MAAVAALIIFLFSFIILLVSNLILTLYILSFGRYALKRVQRSLSKESSNTPKKYTIYIVGKEEKDERSPKVIRIYKDNLIRFSRIFAYLGLTVVIAGIVNVSPIIYGNPTLQRWARRIKSVVSGHGTEKISEIINHISLVIPINLSALLDLKIIESILWVVCLVLLFGIFINWQRIAQHSVESKFEWSKYEVFSVKGEALRYWVVFKVIMYHLFKGELQDEYSVLRGQIVYMVISMSLGLSLTGMFVYASLNI